MLGIQSLVRKPSFKPDRYPHQHDASEYDITDQYQMILNDLMAFVEEDLDMKEGLNQIKSTAVLRAAVKIGILDMVEYLVDVISEPVGLELVDLAARHGNLAVLKYLFSKYTDGGYTHALVHAVKSQNLDVIRYVYGLLKPWIDIPSSVSRQLFWFYVVLDKEPYRLRESLLKEDISSILGDLLHINDDWNYAERYKIFRAFMEEDLPDNTEEVDDFIDSEIPENSSDDFLETNQSFENDLPLINRDTKDDRSPAASGSNAVDINSDDSESNQDDGKSEDSESNQADVKSDDSKSNQADVKSDDSESNQADMQSDDLGSNQVDELMGDYAHSLLRLLVEDHQTVNLKDYHSFLLKSYLYGTAKYGDNQLFPYLVYNKDVTLDIDLLNYAASNGQLLVVRYLIEIAGIEPDVDTMLSAFSSMNSDLICYLFYNREMIGREDLMMRVEYELCRLKEGDKFSDCISELEQLADLKKSAWKNVKVGEVGKVTFDLEKNEVYFVSKYLEQVVNSCGGKRDKKQEDNFLDCISELEHIKSLLNSADEKGKEKGGIGIAKPIGDGDVFFDSISELEKVTSLPRSAMKGTRIKDNSRIQKLDFDLERNELYHVSRYIDESLVFRRQKDQKSAPNMLMKFIEELIHTTIAEKPPKKSRRGKQRPASPSL